MSNILYGIISSVRGALYVGKDELKRNRALLGISKRKEGEIIHKYEIQTERGELEIFVVKEDNHGNFLSNDLVNIDNEELIKALKGIL